MEDLQHTPVAAQIFGARYFSGPRGDQISVLPSVSPLPPLPEDPKHTELPAAFIPNPFSNQTKPGFGGTAFLQPKPTEENPRRRASQHTPLQPDVQHQQVTPKGCRVSGDEFSQHPPRHR